MTIFIIILLILALVGGLLFFQSRLAQSKHQLVVLTRQVEDLRSRITLSQQRTQKLLVKYLIPESRMALTNIDINLFIAPLEDSQVLQKLSVKMEVAILDMALIKGSKWFYVKIPSDDNINCRGWIKEKDFFIFYDSSNSLSKEY
ncbi:MAG: hypothetical protein ACRC7N_18830 [Clostridium sp.]